MAQGNNTTGNNTTDIAALVRSVIERQVATTKSGKALTALDAAAVADLIGQIARNVAQVVEFEIEDRVDAATGMERAA